MGDSFYPNAVWRLDGTGKGEMLPWLPGEPCPHPSPYLWVHLYYADQAVRDWLLESDLLERPLAEAMVDDETRPRVVHHGDGLLITLRGVNLNPGAEPEDMVSIRIWIDKDKIISTRKRLLKSVKELQTMLLEGVGPSSTGEFLVMLLERMTANIGQVIEDLEDQMAEVEEKIVDQQIAARQPLMILRRQAIALRRYLAPQREAVGRLSLERVPWMSGDDHLRLREISDELIRHIEDLDAVRERATLAHEEISNALSEQLNQRMFLLSVVTVIFLPLGFLTGLFGINVGGIPGADSPWGFTAFCLSIAAIITMVVYIFKRNSWL